MVKKAMAKKANTNKIGIHIAIDEQTVRAVGNLILAILRIRKRSRHQTSSTANTAANFRIAQHSYYR